MIRKKLKSVKNSSQAKAYRRKLTIRKKVNGSTDRPRICAVKTNKHLSVQIVDDENSKTLFSVQTFGKNKVADKANNENAKLVGAAVAAGMKERKLEKAVFDRNGGVYTGVIKTLADSIRENGITI